MNNNNNNDNDNDNLFFLLLIILRFLLLFILFLFLAHSKVCLCSNLQTLNAYLESPSRLIRIYVEPSTRNKTSLTFITRSEVFTHSNDERNVVVYIYASNKPSAIIHRAKDNTKFVAVHGTNAYSGNVS